MHYVDSQNSSLNHQSNKPDEPKPPFTDEEVRNIIAFLNALRDIQADLISRGFTIVDGEFVPPTDQ